MTESAVYTSAESAAVDLRSRSSSPAADVRQVQLEGAARVGQKYGREAIRDLMIEIHRISCDLADYHVATMSDAEIEERLETYVRLGAACPICRQSRIPLCRCDLAALEATAVLESNHERWREQTRQEIQRQTLERLGMELSVADPKTRAANVRSTRFSRPATMTAGSRHSTLFPSSATEQETRQKSARFGGKEPGPMVARAKGASH